MGRDILFAVWFMLPAGVANVAPIFAAHIPFLRRFDSPIDNGLTLGGRRLLGDHKTWRGIVSGLILATLFLWLQQLAFIHFGWARFVSGPVDYAAVPLFLLGPAFTLGALGGDALESFFKRRRGIRAGRPWYVFDQLDYVIGAILSSLPFVHATLTQYGLMLVVWFIIHIVSSYAGWALKLKDAPI